MSIVNTPQTTKNVLYFRITGNDSLWHIGSVSDLISKRVTGKILHQFAEHDRENRAGLT